MGTILRPGKGTSMFTDSQKQAIVRKTILRPEYDLVPSTRRALLMEAIWDMISIRDEENNLQRSVSELVECVEEILESPLIALVLGGMEGT